MAILFGSPRKLINQNVFTTVILDDDEGPTNSLALLIPKKLQKKVLDWVSVKCHVLGHTQNFICVTAKIISLFDK